VDRGGIVPPFAPEGDAGWTTALQALLVPLTILAACASVVWGLQDRLATIGTLLRTLTSEFRAPGTSLRHGGIVQVRVLLRRAHLLQRAVVLFYLTMLLQVLTAAWVGASLAGWIGAGTRTGFGPPTVTVPVLLLFAATWASLAAAVTLALADTFLSFRAAQAEAVEAGLADLGRGR